MNVKIDANYEKYTEALIYLRGNCKLYQPKNYVGDRLGAAL
jgi:hypothetical protein